MAFQKFAKVPILSVASGIMDGDTKRVAFTLTSSKHASFYQENSNKIDIQSMLKLVASNYDISPDPHDYVYEAVRAVTAEVPNENGDAFPKDELLRFDHRLGKAVYQTFIGKPHHINHRADNPKHSRGVILDASFNDLSPALPQCPDCGHHTAELAGRDKTGLHCAKCGSTVKDEFVELLLAVDTRKDPTFADGVKCGALDSLSMGCEAGYTDCSICDNRARNIAQFCQHIKSGNKKKMWKTASGMKMSFEKCGEVVFTEISRVDQPADPKAKQSEVLTLSHLPLAAESEMLVMAAKIAKLEALVAQTPSVQDPHPGANEREKACQELQNLMNQTQDPAIREAYQRLISELQEPEHGGPGPVETHEAQFEELGPQVPFRTVGESIRWAEQSIGKLKAEVHKLCAEKDQKYKDASTEGRPFYAWENASFDSQIKAHRQYIARLEDYVMKARLLEASGQPWGKSLTRSMSRFFARKAQDEGLKDLETVKPNLDPELYNTVQKLLTEGPDVPEHMSIDDYQKEREKAQERPISPAEMGISDEDGGLPATIVASKHLEDKIASELDALVDSVKENNVSAETKAFKFASAYKDLEVAVTKSGNVKVYTPAGTLFVVRPENKPADKAAAEKIGSEILAHIANNGIVDTVLKYQTVLGPKMAQVLEKHVEDHQDGREEGDKKPMPEGGEVDHQDGREKPEKSQVGEEHTDRKDEEREQRDQGNAKVVEKHMPDHVEKLPEGYKPAIEEEHSDKAEKREKKTLKDTVLDNIELDHKDKSADEKIKTAAGPCKVCHKEKCECKDKKAQMGAPAPSAPAPAPSPAPAAMPQNAVGEMCAMTECAGKPPHNQHAPGTCPECGKGMAECACKMAQAAPPMAAPSPAPQAPSAPMAAVAEGTSTEKTAGRLDRLYKNRLAKVSEEATKKVADAEKVALTKISSKLLRALKLAAKRQALNLEFSPLKASMCDVLTNKLDVDADSYYPGMDTTTATRIIEASAGASMDAFVDSLVKRATEFMSMNDEAFGAIEADVKNLQPAPLTVTEPVQKVASKEDLRAAAVKGNLALAPSPTSETISNTGNRDNIRSALGTTKVRRASQALLKR